MRSVKLSILALSLAALPGVAQAGESGMVRHVAGMPKMGGMPAMRGVGHMPRTTMHRGQMPRPMIHHGGHQGGPKGYPGMHGGHQGGPKGYPGMHGGHQGGPKGYPGAHGGHQGGPKGYPGAHGGKGGGRHGYWGSRYQGGHMNGYRRPFRGYALPSYWIQPSFYIPNYSYYGFAQPSAGYGWSRYYNDAVLTDRYGRVYDSVYDVDWDRYGNGYDDVGYGDDYGYGERGYRDDRRRGGSGIGGAIAGGAIGAIAGSAIAGRGDRLPGALIGGGLGAIAGAAIDGASDRSRYGRDDRRYRNYRRGRSYDDGYGREVRADRRDEDVTYDGRWSGRWEGTYEGRDGRVYNGTYEGVYDTADGAGGNITPHWGERGGSDYDHPAPAHQAPRLPYPGGYTYDSNYAGGYGSNVTTVTITPQPVTTTTTTTYVEEEVIYAPARKRVVHKPRKVWRPKPKPRCVCY